MTGDYTRFAFAPRKRFSGVLQQQGRVQLDSDWNEAVAIFKRRIRVQALDTFGPFGVAQLTTPDAFDVSLVAGPPVDLSLKPGRIYVDGILAEIFPGETASYLDQPFFPDPPPLPAGDAVIYLDLWEREVTYIEDPSLLDPALGGVDTATRTQSIWQLKVDARAGAVCGMDVGLPASAGRLTTAAIAPPAPDDPCILPPAAGYRGLENRLYRVEIHEGGALGTARFKWSRDNGSIVSAVGDIAVAGGETTLTVDRLGRDQVLRFIVGNWVTVTDDFRELAGEPGEMARVVAIDEANAKLTLDRALPSPGGRAFGANPAELAARHTRIQRWDETAAVNTVDANGLIATAAGPIDLEDGIQISFATDPAGGVFNDGDYWVFWARTATASIEILNAAPPRGILHHYVQLAAATGLGGGGATVSDCRPSVPVGEACCCTFVVAPGQDIQKAIDALPAAGGCVCLKTGLHLISETLTIARSDVRLVGESPGTIVRLRGAATVLLIGMRQAVQDVAVCGIAFERETSGNGGAVIEIGNAMRVSIEDCAARALDPPLVIGVGVQDARQFTLARCVIDTVESGIWITGKDNSALIFTDNLIALDGKPQAGRPAFGILAQQVQSGLRIEGNTIGSAANGILVNDSIGGAPSSSAQRVEIIGNAINCIASPSGEAAAAPAFGIDSAADLSNVSRNLVLLPENADPAQIGIRLTGSQLQARDNDVLLSGSAGGSGPAGIQLGYLEPNTSVLTTNLVIAGNTVERCPAGIVAMAVDGAEITDNLLEMNARSQGISAGISLTGCIGVDLHDNQIVDFTIAIAVDAGVANRFAANIIAGGSQGIFLSGETTPVVTQNRITDVAQFAIGGVNLTARCDVTDNRIAACGYFGPGSFSIAFALVMGELRIAGNEVIDTGVPLAGTPVAPVYGITAMWVLEATVEGNQVTYTDPTKRDPTAEDRALLIGGLIETESPFGVGLNVLGYPVQILGNKFVGAGQSALVELVQTQVNDLTYRRFERVIFSNNYCWHLANPAPPPPAPTGNATVRLTGRAASVLGNQVKSASGVPSFDFNNMPGPFMGNVISGSVTRHTDLPAPESTYNMTLL